LKYYLLTYLLIFFCSPAFSRETRSDTTKTRKKGYWFSELKYTPGYMLPTSRFLEGRNKTGSPINFYHSGAFLLGKRTYGLHEWEQHYNYPEYGIAFYHASFFNGNEELGRPCAVYGFFRAPIRKYNNATLKYQIGMGYSFNWRPYDPIDNQYNLLIGSNGAMFFEFNLLMEIPLSKKFFLIPGIGYTHSSNGSLYKPNAGINMVGPCLSIHYDFNPDLPKKIIREKFTPKPDHEFLFSLGGGAKQLQVDTMRIEAITPWLDEWFYAITSTLSYQKRISQILKLGCGTDIIYDDSFATTISVDEEGLPYKDSLNIAEGFSTGLFGSIEVELHKLSVSFAMGGYILRGTGNEDDSNFFQVLGLKYYFLKNTSIGINLRTTDFSNADHISWTIGQRFAWFRKSKLPE